MAVIGSEHPRLGTPPRGPLTEATTRGYDLISFAEQIGVNLLPWQRQVALRALEVNPDGTYRFRTVLILVGRQCGKTTLLMVWALWRLYRDDARLVLGAAQKLDIAREAWQGSVNMAYDTDLLQVRNVRYANGEQCLTTDDGARYRLAATNRGAGRGLSVDMLIMDEVREQRDWTAWAALSKTTIARPKGQIVCISNAGDDNSVVLNSLRDAALGEKDDRLCLLEWSAPEGCDLNDRSMWAMSLPALGHTLPEDSVAASIATDPPAVARTELLCQHVSNLDTALDGTGWSLGADPQGSVEPYRKNLTACVDVSMDGNHVALVVAAALEDGRVRVEPVASWTATAAARAELPELLARIDPMQVAWYPGGPANALAPVLANLPNARPINGSDLSAACMGFADLVKAGMVVHNSDALLDSQVGTASKLTTGDRFTFTRKGRGNCNALYAAAGATLCAMTAKPRRAKVFVA